MSSYAFVGRIVRSLAVLAVAMLAQPAWAVINCEIIPASSQFVGVTRGGSVTLPFDVTGAGCGPSITTSISEVSNTTGPIALPAPDTAGPGRRSPSVFVGSTVGTLVVQVTCTAGCFGTPANLSITYTIEATPVRTLDALGSTSLTEEAGATGTISLRASDDGVPAGTTVVFSTSGPVSVSPTSVNTDVNGVATVTATFGPGTGAATIVAERVDNPGFPVTFSIDVQPLLPQSIFKVSGDFQSAQTGGNLPAPLVVETRNSGVATGGVGINWSVVSGDATLAFTGTLTDGSGRAETNLLLGPAEGPIVVRATRADNATIFTEFNVDSFISRSLVRLSGDNQTGALGTTLPIPLVVVAGNNGVPTPGVAISWSISLGTGTLVSTTTTTDTSGRAQTLLVLPSSAQIVQVTAVRADATDLPTIFTATAVALVRSIAPISGDGQTGATSAPLANPLVVEARDNGTPAPGIGINWSVVSGDATLVSSTSPTDTAGRAQTGLVFGPTPGPVVVNATRADDSTVLTSFTVSSTLTRTIGIVSGNGQTGPSRAPLANPLVIEAQNNGSPAAGIGITWSVVSGDATLVSPGAATDTGGRAQTGLLFGPTPGPVVVRATRNDDSTVQTEFTVTSTLTRTLVPVNGNNQTGPTRTPASNPLVIEARDNGTPAPGVGITWSVVSGDATITAAGSPTNASGQAQASISFGPTPGPIVVRATRNDDATVQATFTLASTLTRTLAIVSGNNQTAQTRGPLANPLVVEARDNGLPAPATGILWSVVSGDATLVSPTSPTDAGGRAQSGVLFGATPGPVVIRATRADDASARAEFTVTSTFTRTITVISGANQQGLAGLPLPSPIVVEVRGNGLPEAGVAVEVTVQGNATVSGDADGGAKASRLTGSDGRASFVVTLGPAGGTVNIVASVPATPGLSISAAATGNSLENLPGLPEPLRELGGVVQRSCVAIAAIQPSLRTPEQADLLARCQSFAGVPPEQLGAALDELLPDTTLAMVSVALQAGQAQLDNLKGRLAALRSGTGGSRFGGLALASPVGIVPVSDVFNTLLGATEAPEAGAEFARWGWFVSGTLGRGESEAGRRTPAFDFDINGLTAGVDYRFSDRLVAGASLGLTKQDTELDGGEGNVDASGYSVSGYATYYRDQSWYTDAVLTLGRNDYETLRRIRYTITGPGGTSSIDQQARGQLDGDLLSFASTIGRDYQAGSWTIGPYGRLLYTRIAFDSAREVITGGPGSGFALEIFPGEHTSFASVVGGKFSSAISRDWGILMPHFQVEWEREYRDDPQRVGARFLADPTAQRFTIDGDPIDNSFFRLGAGLSVLFTGGRSGFVYVERVIGKSGFTQTNLALGLRGEF